MTTELMRCDNCAKMNRVPTAASGLPRCGSCHVALAWIAAANDDTYDDVVATAAIPVLVDLWAPWCGPCRSVSPVLEKLAHQFAGRVKLVKIDVDQSPAASRRFAVQGIPTLLVLERGEVLARQVGAAGEQALRAWLEQALPTAAASDSSENREAPSDNLREH